MIRIVINFLFWGFVIHPGVASSAAAAAKFATAAQQTSARQTINLNLHEVSLKNTLQILCTRLGKNLLLDPEVEERSLNMSLQNITPMEAFNAILEANELAYKEMDGNVLFVAAAAKIGKQTVVRSIACKYADTQTLQEILKSLVISEAGAVISDKRTNTLIIKESPEVIERMQKLITVLDQPTKQVYIQAEILEVSTTDNLELGVEWLGKNIKVGSTEARVGTNFDLQTQPVTGTTDNTDQTDTENADAFSFPSGSGLGIGILHTNINAVLRALSEVNNVNLLSRPRIVTMDNQESTIEVGDQIPFKKLNEFGVTSFEFKDATVQLLVKPHIIDSTYILLRVSPKADFQNGFTPDGTPIISTRRASTNVKVKNGQTIVIGGLIRDSIIKNEKKVPILGSIPILGNLFKSKRSSKVKTELIVFITPTILEDGMATGTFTNEFEKRERFKKKVN